MEWPTLDPGSMTIPIRVTKPMVIAGASGAEVAQEEVLTGYAAIDEEHGDEARGVDQAASRERFILRTWFDDRVKSNMRIETDHGTWNIERVVDVRKMGVVMRIFCVALGANE